MEKQNHFSKFLSVFRNRTTYEVIAGIIIIAAIVGFGEYRRLRVVKDLAETQQQLNIEKEGLEQRISIVETQLTGVKDENLLITSALRDQLQAAENKSTTFQEEIGKIASTVGTLDKLSKTDPQLLQKYSKVYFLNEHFVPVELRAINPTFVSEAHPDLQIHASVSQYLEKLLSDASQAGFHLQVVSAYRSFGTQSQLKASYKFTYGAGTANQFSAEQGYSEHQLGTTVDLTTAEMGAIFAAFDKTPEFSWLVANAHVYGFILSYPKDNAYYQYEPWHWRFVGVALATRLHNEGKYFYDYDQREINTYLAKIFD